MAVSTVQADGGAMFGGRRLAGLGAGLALGAAACAGGGSDGGSVEIEATPAGLADAAARSAADTYRFEMAMSFGGGDAVPVASGAADGDRFEMTFDLGDMFEALSEQMELTEDEQAELDEVLRDVDLTMDMVGDESVWYIRAPFFAEMAEDPGPNTNPEVIEDLIALGDGWGRVDVDRLGDVAASDFAGALGGSEVPTDQEFLDLLSDVADVEQRGPGEVRGEEVTGLAAKVRFGDLVEASGGHAEALTADAETDEVEQALLDITMPVEVWVGDDGVIRQASYTLDIEAIAEASGEDIDDLADEAAALGLDNLDLGFTIDFFDHGEPVTIEFPEDAVDLTDVFNTIAEETQVEAEAAAEAVERLDEIDARLDEIETRLGEIDGRLEQIDAEWGELEARDQELQAENDAVIAGPTSLEQVRRLDEILEEQLVINDKLAALADEQLALHDERTALSDERFALLDEQTTLLLDDNLHPLKPLPDDPPLTET